MRWRYHPSSDAGGALRDLVLLRTDFPYIPYACAHQLDALTRRRLDDDSVRAVLWHNGARLFGVSADVGGVHRDDTCGGVAHAAAAP